MKEQRGDARRVMANKQPKTVRDINFVSARIKLSSVPLSSAHVNNSMGPVPLRSPLKVQEGSHVSFSFSMDNFHVVSPIK